MMIAKIGGVEIPAVYAIETDRQIIGDRARTAGGKMRQDLVTIKRTWQLQTRPITGTQANALFAVIDGAVDFWLDEFGEDTVKAYVTISDKRSQFGLNGVWQKDGREITLTVEEQ